MYHIQTDSKTRGLHLFCHDVKVVYGFLSFDSLCVILYHGAECREGFDQSKNGAKKKSLEMEQQALSPPDTGVFQVEKEADLV